MKEHPILFSGPMVRAILEGRKTQTRRVLKPQPDHPDVLIKYPNVYKTAHPDLPKDYPDADPGEMAGRDEWVCPYGQPGDRLWVRETHQFVDTGKQCVAYAADGNIHPLVYGIQELPMGVHSHISIGADVWDGKWRPSIFMPRWASRITLEVTDIRVERLIIVSEQDAIAEGVTWDRFDDFTPIEVNGFISGPARIAFKSLWDSINGKPRKDGTDISWNANPWVWVVEFKRLEGGC